MATELKEHAPGADGSHDPHDGFSGGGGGGGRRPLLKPNPSAPDVPITVDSESIEAMEKLYAAYVRKDAYGTMGRGELPASEKVLLGFAMVTLVPIRLVVGILILVIYYLICRGCTLFKAPNRENEQEDYAHMGGWRREVVIRCGRLLSRAMLFNFGFYWIKEIRRDTMREVKIRKIRLSTF